MLQIDCLHHFDELSSCTVNLDIRHLKLVVAVTEEQSVTRAGEVLHLTQSALSHQLREIEEKLGTPLFLRMNKNLILYVTPEESTLFEKILRPAGVTPARLSTVPLTEAIIEMVKAGLGISALARWAVKDQIANGRIVARPIT